MRSTLVIPSRSEIRGTRPPGRGQTGTDGEAALILVPGPIGAPEPALRTRGRSARITTSPTADTTGAPLTEKGQDTLVRTRIRGRGRALIRKTSTGGHIPDLATRGARRPTPLRTEIQGLLTLSRTGTAK